MQRIGLLIIPGIVAVAVFVGITSFDSVRNEPALQSQHQNPDFNSYSEGINTSLYRVDGNINYTLQAQRQVHYNDKTIKLEKPFIRLFQDGESRWNIIADSGKISSAKTENETTVDTIELLGNVQVYCLDNFGNRTLMSTEYLTLDPNLEVLETDNPVSVVTDTLHQSSVGMVANLKLDEIKFLSEIRGRYEQTSD